MSKIKDTTRVPRCVNAVLNKTESHSLVKTGKERGNNRGYPSPAPEATLVTPGTFSWRGRVLSNTLRRIARACSPMATAPSMFVKWTPIPGAIPQSRRPKGKNFRPPTPPAGTHGCPRWAPGRGHRKRRGHPENGEGLVPEGLHLPVRGHGPIPTPVAGGGDPPIPEVTFAEQHLTRRR
jgi:hypothetical protein